MKKLVAYDKEQAETLKLIYESKKTVFKIDGSDDEFRVEELIRKKSSIIIDGYINYETLKKQLENIYKIQFSELEKKSLLHCYEHPTKALNNLKKQIKDNQPIALKSICPYCGINNSGTYDHYIPKNEYPEYSVYGPNLILCCGECNTIKGDKWKSENNERYFFNFYYDSIPNFEIIESVITIEENVPKIRFEFIKNDKCFEYEKLVNSFTAENHYTRLHLLTRFKEACNSYIAETVNSLKAHKCYDEESIKDFLVCDHHVMIDTYGINYWKSITIKGMLNSSDFIKYCSKESIDI